MIGVVLCGGQSTRMGSDKGLMKQGNLTWTEVAVAKLRSLGIPVVVSVNRKQVDTYSKTFSLNELIVDGENILVGGPLLGLMSVHCQFPGEDLFVIACDMIEMNTTLLEFLFDSHEKSAHGAYIYSTEETIQPLCGIYNSKGLEKLKRLLQQKLLKKFSMMHALEYLEVKTFVVPQNFFSCFTNYNYSEQMNNCNFKENRKNESDRSNRQIQRKRGT